MLCFPEFAHGNIGGPETAVVVARVGSEDCTICGSHTLSYLKGSW